MARETKRQKTWALLTDEAGKVTGSTPGADDFDAAMVLLASTIVGPSVVRVAYATKLPRERIRPWALNLRRNGVWRGSKVSGAAWFEKDGGVALLLDLNVALGFMDRVPDESVPR